MVKFTFEQWEDRQGVDCQTLSNLRPEVMEEIDRYRCLSERIANTGICFSINPTDIAIEKLGETGIKVIVQKAFDRYNTMYCFIPEYNTERHKLHYHGVCKVKDYETLTKIKRSISRQVGRTESEAMKSVDNWTRYMFKSYDEDQPSHIWTVWRKENIITPKGLII